MTSRLVVQACEIVDLLLTPPEETSGDTLRSPVDNVTLGACDEAELRTISNFAKLGDVLARLAPVSLANTAPSATAMMPSSPVPMIEEVFDQNADVDREQLVMAKSCQAAALYAADAALLTPWSTHHLDVASRTLLKQLRAAIPGAVATPQQKASTPLDQQDFFVAMMPAVLPLLSPALTYDGEHSVSQCTSQQQGPDCFTRSLAARQLAFLIRQLDYQHLTSILPSALPYILAAVKDPSPKVQCYGLQALQHVATEALPADLRAYQRQLMAVAQEMLVGCDDTTWMVAAPTSCSILCTLGTSLAAYQEVVKELLRQAATQCYKQERRLVWLRAVKPTFEVLGLHTLRFFSSLMPLLLGWCCEPDQATCLEALEALHEVIKHTWPRMPAHASFLWSQLQQISTLHPQMQVHGCQGPKQHADAQIRNCIAKIANTLYLCGGSLFQKSIHGAWKQSKDPTTDVMLQSIELDISAPEHHL